MMRKRRLPATLNLQLHEGGMLQTQQLTPPVVEEDYKFYQQDQINDNKKFLTQMLKFSNLAVKLPESITSRSIEQVLRALNVRLASIASSKQILADYQKHFRALNTFFDRLINQGKRLPADEEVIWRMFFLNNTAVIAFNNGDYTTSLQLLRTITNERNKKQIKQPVFTLAITNLSAIYYKMDSKVKCFEHLESAFEYSKKLVDSIGEPGYDLGSETQLNCVLAIQCIMMVKNRQSVETSTHNVKEIEKLIIKLIKQGRKFSTETMNIPFINKYLQQKKFSQLKEMQSSVAGSQPSSKRSRKRNYHLESLNYEYNAASVAISQDVLSDNTEMDSPVKRYSYNKIKLENDEINAKVARLQLKVNKVQQSVIEILNILKNNNKVEQKSTAKDSSAINHIQNTLGISHIASRFVFKTLQVFITFYDQGIKLKTFTGEEEKLSWGELQNIFKLLDLLHVYFQYVELNPTRHTIAWVIAKYITIENGIKIRKEPSPILWFQHNQQKYGLYHVREREFTIYGPQVQAIMFEMCEKSFNYYFQILKIDQFQAESLMYFSDEPSKIREDYFLEVIQVKAGGTFEEDILEVFENFIIVLKETNNKPISFRKVKLWFDETTDACNFLGCFYSLTQNNELRQIQVKLYPLNNYEGIVVTNPILKILTFNDLQTRYSFSFQLISRLNLQHCVNRIQAIKRDGKTRHVVHTTNTNPECIYFQQRMLLKKFYRPVFIYVMRTKNRYISIRISHYNETQLLTTNITVVLNAYITKKMIENPDQMQKKFVKIKERIKTQFLAKQFGQIESGMEGKNFIHVEEFIGMIEAETKNWGQ